VGTLDKNDKDVGTGLVGAPACLHGDTLVALADGRDFLPIKDLVGQEFPVYSYDEANGLIISKAFNVRKTRKNTKTLKIILDDGSSFVCTPDHLIRTRSRKHDKWVRAKDLNEGQSLMPFYKVTRKNYWWVYHNKIQANGEIRSPEHRLVYEHNFGVTGPGFQIHHKNHKKKDNFISNLEALTGAEHLNSHNVARWKAGLKPKGRDISGNRNPMRAWWSNATKEEKSRYRTNMSLSTSGKRNGRWIDVSVETLIDHGREILSKEGKLTAKLWCNHASLNNLPQNLNPRFGSFGTFKEAVISHNHKVVKIEVHEKCDVYCMTVEDTENFAIVTEHSSLQRSGVIVHNCGDVMRLQIKVDPETLIIEDAKFKTFGCGSAIASSSLITEWIKGKSLNEAGELTNEEIVKELDLPPVKIHCSVLAEDAVKQAIADFRNKQKKTKSNKRRLPVV